MADKRKMQAAHSLEEAANSNNSLEGYVAMNADLHDEIARLAYQLYEDRGRQDGFHEEDWFQAENEIRNRRNGEQQRVSESARPSRL